MILNTAQLSINGDDPIIIVDMIGELGWLMVLGFSIRMIMRDQLVGFLAGFPAHGFTTRNAGSCLMAAR
jgi:hypothetical protein